MTKRERVGVAIVAFTHKGDGTRGATMMAYIDEKYRGQGLFKQMVD